jgi:hypothetical protein
VQAQTTPEVDPMHVLDRPRLPRLVSVTIAAAILAIAISLALASTLNNVSQSSSNTVTPVRHAAPALTSVLQTDAPRWASNPFSSLFTRPLPQPWPTARRR